MKIRLATAALLLAAGVLYLAGFSGGGTAAFGAAVSLEVLFWVRVIRGKARRRSVVAL